MQEEVLTEVVAFLTNERQGRLDFLDLVDFAPETTRTQNNPDCVRFSPAQTVSDLQRVSRTTLPTVTIQYQSPIESIVGEMRDIEQALEILHSNDRGQYNRVVRVLVRFFLGVNGVGEHSLILMWYAYRSQVAARFVREMLYEWMWAFHQGVME